MKKLIEPD